MKWNSKSSQLEIVVENKQSVDMLLVEVSDGVIFGLSTMALFSGGNITILIGKHLVAKLRRNGR